MKIKVLYEDTNVLAIVKPTGVSVHGDGKSKDKTIGDWVLENYPRMKNVGENETYEYKNTKVEIKKPGIVHRLDRETSGILLLAKNKKSYESLKKQFSAPALNIKEGIGLDEGESRVKKIYVAIVNGHTRHDRGVINKPIGRSPRDFRRYLAGRGVRGEIREAITEYRVLKRFEISGFKYTYLEVRPKTGRTHQIRVHLKYLNHPIVCDALYNPDNPCPKGLTRMGLHAKSIEFKDLSGKAIKVESPIPREFKEITG